MPIPDLDENGRLPPGVHSCTLADVLQRFGQFQDTDQRVKLAEKLQDYVREVCQLDEVVAVIVDGSFVTSASSPNDIDLIVVIAAGHDFGSELRPFEYNALSRRRVQRRYGFDILVAEEGAPELAEYVEFFARIRGLPDERKGLVRVSL